MPRPSIETRRMVLRPWKAEDHAAFARICADPEVMRYIGDGSTKTPEQASKDIEAFEQEWKDCGFGLFAVELKETGALAGFAGLSTPKFLPEILPSVEIGWRLDRALWGQGLATEAGRAALDFGVGELGLRTIVSICQIDNRASERIMIKLGLAFDRRTTVPSSGATVHVYRLPETAFP